MPVEAGSLCAEARGSNLASRLPWKLAEAPCISFAHVHMLSDPECQRLHEKTRCGHYSQVKLKQPGNLNCRISYFWLLEEFDCVRYSRRVCRGCCAEASWKLSGSSPNLHSRVQGSDLLHAEILSACKMFIEEGSWFDRQFQCFQAAYIAMSRACVELDDLLRAIKP